MYNFEIYGRRYSWRWQGGGEGRGYEKERDGRFLFTVSFAIYNPNITPDYIEPHSTDWILIIAFGTYHALPPLSACNKVRKYAIHKKLPAFFPRGGRSANFLAIHIYMLFSFFPLSSLMSSLLSTQPFFHRPIFSLSLLISDSTSLHFLLSSQVTRVTWIKHEKSIEGLMIRKKLRCFRSMKALSRMTFKSLVYCPVFLSFP